MRRTVKCEELSIRLAEADVVIIDRAAALRGRSRAAFVRSAAVRAAEEVLMDIVPVRMSAATFKTFTSALLAPPTLVPSMVELFKRPAPWESQAASGEADPGPRRKQGKHEKGSHKRG